MKRKSVATKLAEFLGSKDDITNFEFQPGRWSPRVYEGMDGGLPWYWSAGPVEPKHRFGECPLTWKAIESRNGRLWKGFEP